MDKDKKEVGSWWIWTLFLLAVSITVFTGLKYMGVFGERIVFENSFQYKEARKSEVNTFEASLAEINSLLSSPSLDKETRQHLEAKAASIRIMLKSARSK